MSSTQHHGGAGMTQNQGNVIGDRPSVRQAGGRQHSGDAMKGILGGGDSSMFNAQQQQHHQQNRQQNQRHQAHEHQAQQAQHQQPPQQQFSGSEHPHDRFRPNNQSKLEAKRAQWAAEQQTTQQLNSENKMSQQPESKSSVRCAGRANQQSFSALG